MTIQDDIKALGAEDFAALKAWIVTTETDRRAAAPVIEEARREQKAETAAEVVAELAKTNANLKPPSNPSMTARPWKVWHPTDPSTHFYYGDLATQDGKTHRSVVDASRTQPNVWQPGAEGIDERYWVEVLPEPAPDTAAPADTVAPAPTTPAVAAFKQPTGAHDAYAQGARVTFEGSTYESLIAANAYSPSAYPAGWKKV